MEYKDDKPFFYLTNHELKNFNIESTRRKEKVGYFTPLGKKTVSPLYYAEEEIKHLPFYENKYVLPFGFVTKGTAYNYGIKINADDSPVAITKEEKHGYLNAAYDKREDPFFLRFGHLINLKKEELLRSGLPVYDASSLPETFVPVYKAKAYFMDKEKEPSGLYLSRQGKYWHVFDLKDEIEKPHYHNYKEVPYAYFTKNEIKNGGLAFSDLEIPVAYYVRYKNDIVALYDRTKHPKYRLRKLTSAK